MLPFRGVGDEPLLLFCIYADQHESQSRAAQMHNTRYSSKMATATLHSIVFVR